MTQSREGLLPRESTRSQDKNKTKIYAIAFCIITLFALSKIFKITALSYLGAAVAFFGSVLFKTDESFLLLFALLPNTFFSTVQGNAICGYLAMLYCARVLFNNRRIPRKLLVTLFAFIMACALSFVHNQSTAVLFQNVKIFFYFLSFALFFLSTDGSAVIEDFIHLFSFGNAVGVVWGLVYYLVRGISLFSIQARFCGLSADPNYFSTINTFSFTALLTLGWIRHKYQKYEIAEMAFLLVCSCLSLSRGFILSMAVILVAYFFLSKKRTIRISRVIATVFITGVLIVIFRDSITAFIKSIVTRNKNDIDLGNGRVEIWIEYLKITFSSVLNALLGAGDAGYFRTLYDLEGIEHNTVIQILLNAGICGLIVYGYCIRNIQKMLYSVRAAKESVTAFIFPMLLSCTVPYLFLSGYGNENFTFCILLSCMMPLFADEERKNHVFENR